MKRLFFMLGLGVVAFAAAFGVRKYIDTRPPAPRPGMAWIPGGEFLMGTDSDQAWPEETPAHRVFVDGFWMDRTEVTNAQFRAFVQATGYVTTAEKTPDGAVLRYDLAAGVAQSRRQVIEHGSRATRKRARHWRRAKSREKRRESRSDHVRGPPAPSR